MTDLLGEKFKTRGEKSFGDVWALTCAQLGETLEHLLRLQPDASMIIDDLIGYHFVQFGVPRCYVKESLELALGSPDRSFTEVLAKILNESGILHETITTPVRTERIFLSRRLGAAAEFEVSPELEEAFDVQVHQDERGLDCPALVPYEGDELYYYGRSTVALGEIGRRMQGGGFMLENPSVYVDKLVLRRPDREPKIIEMISRDNGNIYYSVETIKILNI